MISQANLTLAPERIALLEWTARVGAVTPDALAHLEDLSLAGARARLGWLTRARLLSRRRLLVDEASLYTITRAGLRQLDGTSLEPCRVSVANAPHTIACARAAAVLQRLYPDHLLAGERDLRARERAAGRPLASVRLASAGAAPRGLHRPDLVLWPSARDRLPVAVEVELTVKAPERLAEICRAWARSQEVAGVVYLAPPRVRRALERAIARGDGERIVVLALEALSCSVAPERGSSVSSQARRTLLDGGQTIEQTESTCPASRSTESSSSAA